MPPARDAAPHAFAVSPRGVTPSRGVRESMAPEAEVAMKLVLLGALLGEFLGSALCCIGIVGFWGPVRPSEVHLLLLVFLVAGPFAAIGAVCGAVEIIRDDLNEIRKELRRPESIEPPAPSSTHIQLPPSWHS
jgi:hypothetical protein